jgi:hypothetical protein
VGPQETAELRCGNCGIAVPWQPVVVGAAAFCCGGCAQGGPCYCSYDPPESEPAERPRRRQIGRLPLRRDGEVHDDQDGAGVRLGVDGQVRVGPVDGRPGVEVARLRHPPGRAGGDASQRH